MTINAYLLYYEFKAKPPNEQYTVSRSIHCENIGDLLYHLRECEKLKHTNIIISTIQDAKPRE